MRSDIMQDNTADANVTLGDQQDEGKNKYFPCPICGEMREVSYSKRSKPYCTCNDCGVQRFIRGKTGIKKLKDLISNIINLIDYYEKLSEKLNEIRARKPILSRNDNLDAQEKLVEKQLKVLGKKLKSMEK